MFIKRIVKRDCVSLFPKHKAFDKQIFLWYNEKGIFCIQIALNVLSLKKGII